MSDRRSFSEEFKADAVEMVISSGSSLTDVSAVLGVNVQIAYNWLYSQNTKPRKPQTKRSEQQQVLESHREKFLAAITYIWEHRRR
ncbi:transposase [Glutamicibacter sp. BW77]|uniref:Transposase n=2 Tax=Glutamicibacter TaxID=1742989 RepID=A0ABV9MPG3_9MICC|nr:transposase [Glutamicibacter sp. BW77]PCC36544.1 hypothetical protein CIK74_05180 [Glutamicibacter sp. BW77]